MIATMKLSQVKKLFLDTRMIRDRQKRGTLKALSKFGGRVRIRAKHSIRKRKGISKPDNPPHSHTGLLRDNIFYIVEPAVENVVMGPIKINKPSPKILEALEHGGDTLIMERSKGQKRLVPTEIEARPFMRPTFDAELEKAPDLWKGSLR